MFRVALSIAILVGLASPVASQDSTRTAPPPDPIARLVARLDLERYKATIKSLTQFGDRRQGTARNRAAVDWIEQQLRSYGCSDVTRLTYDFSPPSIEGRAGQGSRTGAQVRDTTRAVGGGRYRGIRAPTGVNTDSLRQPHAQLPGADTQQR